MPFDSQGRPFNCLKGSCTVQCDLCRPNVPPPTPWEPTLNFFCICGQGFETRQGLRAHCRYDLRHYPYDTPPPEPDEQLTEPVWWTDLVPSHDVAHRKIKDTFVHGYLGVPNTDPLKFDRRVINPLYREPVIMAPRTFAESGYGRLSKKNRLFRFQAYGKFEGKWLYFPVGRPPFPKGQ